MNKTFIPASNYNKRKWYVIDCKDKQLGRLASTIVPLLTGKSKSISKGFIRLSLAVFHELHETAHAKS